MSAKYGLRIDKRVIQEIKRISAEDAERIMRLISSLATNPRPRGAKKLVDQPGWRQRKGQYRVLYEIDDKKQLITVYRAGHRRKVYR